MSGERAISTDKEVSSPAERCVCIDWYSEGQSRVVEVDGVHIVGRKSRRGRIAIEAPVGAEIRTPLASRRDRRSS